MSANNLSNSEFLDRKDQLVGFAQIEQDRTNVSTSDTAAIYDRLTELAQLLNRECPWLNRFVTAEGPQFVSVPKSNHSQSGESTSYDDSYVTGRRPLGNTLVYGKSAGFIPQIVELDVPGIGIIPYGYICHHVLTESNKFSFVEEGVLTKTVGKILPVENTSIYMSELPNLAHDIRNLRKSEEELYSEIDSIIYSDALSVPAKLSAMQKILVRMNFRNLSHRKQTEVASYINDCQIFEDILQTTRFVYALGENVQTDGVFLMKDGVDVHALIGNFTISSHYSFFTVEGKQSMRVIGSGLSIEAELIKGTQRRNVRIPLNQKISFI